jgi:hypothetical protein
MLYVMLALGEAELRPKIVLLLSLFALFCTAGLSQTISGSISGFVLDSTGASVGQAKVTATDLDRKFSVTSVTDASGHYAFPSLQPGHYTISVEAAGFKKFETTGLTLLGNQNLVAPKVTLQLGDVTESVQVSAEGVQLQTDTAERSESLDSKQVTNIALNGRSYLPLVALVPGVTTAPSLPTASHSGVGSITVNGGRSNQNNLTLEAWAMSIPVITATSLPP